MRRGGEEGDNLLACSEKERGKEKVVFVLSLGCFVSTPSCEKRRNQVMDSVEN
jgi:hypothetical protein